MGVGIEVYNDQGTLQFTSEDSLYGLVGSGSVQVGSGSGYRGLNFAYIENVPVYDTVALSSRDGCVRPGPIGNIDTTNLLIQSNTANSTVRYFLFRNYSKLPRPAGGVGIEILKPDGTLAYSTAYRPMAVGARVPITNPRYDMSDTYSLPDSREWAFLQYGNLNAGGKGPGSYNTAAGNNPGSDVGGAFDGIDPAIRLGNGQFVVEEIRGAGYGWGLPITGGVLAVDVSGI